MDRRERVEHEDWTERATPLLYIRFTCGPDYEDAYLCLGDGEPDMNDLARMSFQQARTLLAALADADADTVRVPREPTEAMWGGLARDIVMWRDMEDRPTGAALYKHLDRAGTEIPDWLREEIPDIDHVPPKGSVAVAIYRAMIAAADRERKDQDDG